MNEFRVGREYGSGCCHPFYWGIITLLSSDGGVVSIDGYQSRDNWIGKHGMDNSGTNKYNNLILLF